MERGGRGTCEIWHKGRGGEREHKERKRFRNKEWMRGEFTCEIDGINRGHRGRERVGGGEGGG